MQSKADLSERQREVYEYIKAQQKLRGYPPSVREIGQALGMSSSSTVHMHLTQLQEKGWIRKDPTKPRAIEILDADDEPAQDTVSLPIVGRVAAGVPITAIENIDGYFSVSADFLGRGNHFILQVRGDSMIEAGILDGDMVIVRAQEVANNGEIVIAMLDGEATVKRFYRKDGYIELRPENSTMEPIVSHDVSIAGIVSGLIRRM